MRIGVLVVGLLATSACSSLPRTDPSGGDAATPVVGDPIEDQRRLVARGRSQFLHCNSCHVVSESDPPPFGDNLGPHLENLIGRPAGSVDDFEYTEALQSLDLVWDEETLDQWLQAPQALVPDMCAPFDGIAKPEHRKALIAYLKASGN